LFRTLFNDDFSADKVKALKTRMTADDEFGNMSSISGYVFKDLLQ